VLFTPTAFRRKYVWMEMGMFYLSGKRIVAAMYGVSKEDIASDPEIPVFLKGIDSVELNDIESYFGQLEHRVTEWRASNG